MAYSYNRNQRIYLLPESTFGVCPNSAGAASFAGSDCALVLKASFKPNVDLIESQSKTGTRTVDAGTSGRRSGKWSIEVELRTSGTAGTVPDIDVLWACAFGSNPVVAAGTSVTYSISDSIKSFSVFNARTPSTVLQQVAIGCVVTEVTISMGENTARCAFSGDCLWVADSVTFAQLGSGDTGKGGLTAIPSEPGTPTTTGAIIAGFTGGATVDGNLLADIRNGTIKFNTGNAIPLDKFGSYYGGAPEGDTRSVTLSFSTYDNDSAAQTNLYSKALTKAKINAAMQIGTVPGNIYTFNVKGVQLATQDITEGQRKWQADFSDSRAAGTSLGSLDELNAVLT